MYQLLVGKDKNNLDFFFVFMGWIGEKHKNFSCIIIVLSVDRVCDIHLRIESNNCNYTLKSKVHSQTKFKNSTTDATFATSKCYTT